MHKLSRTHHSSIIAAVVAAAGCVAPSDTGEDVAASTAETERHGHVNNDCDWSQWGSDPAHTGQACRGTRHFDRITAHTTFDPFTEEEKADTEADFGEGVLLTHYQAPLLVGDDVYMELKAGEYTSCTEDPVNCGPFGWNSQVWTERKLSWHHGELVEDWTFAAISMSPASRARCTSSIGTPAERSRRSRSPAETT
jgi:hypothetical protein